MSPFVIEKVLQGSVCQTAGCKKMRQGGLLVEVTKKVQADNLMKMTEFFNVEVSVSAHRSLNSCKGVIQCRDLAELDPEEVLDNMKDKGVTNAQHINRLVNGKKFLLAQ